jgi:hypothetical protein
MFYLIIEIQIDVYMIQTLKKKKFFSNFEIIFLKINLKYFNFFFLHFYLKFFKKRQL